MPTLVEDIHEGKKKFGVNVNSKERFFAKVKATQKDPCDLPYNRGCLIILPNVTTVSNGTANLVTIRTEDIVWNPSHTGIQLTKKLARFTKPRF